MAGEPKITWENKVTKEDMLTSGWKVGTVKADTESEVLQLRIWNGKGTQEALSTAQGCSLYILDKNQAKTEPIVKEGWLQGKCISTKQGSFTALNDASELQVGAEKMEAQQISGKINNGDDEAVENFSDLELKFKVPANAMYGDHPFTIVMKYFFV